MADKISHLNNAGFLKSEHKKRTELSLPNGAGYIFSYHPFESMQIIFFDIHSSEIPDLWQLGFRKGDEGRYLRTLICKRGSCHFFVNGSEGILLSGQVMMDYGIGDDKLLLKRCVSPKRRYSTATAMYSTILKQQSKPLISS